jgi:hypothetical protein
VSLLLEIRQALETTDAICLTQLDHTERRRFADILRSWAYAADYADNLARAEALLPPALDLIGFGPPPRVGPRRVATQQDDCQRGHPLIDANVYFRDGSPYRYCKVCRNTRQRNARRLLRARRKSMLVRCAP